MGRPRDIEDCTFWEGGMYHRVGDGCPPHMSVAAYNSRINGIQDRADRLAREEAKQCERAARQREIYDLQQQITTERNIRLRREEEEQRRERAIRAVAEHERAQAVAQAIVDRLWTERSARITAIYADRQARIEQADGAFKAVLTRAQREHPELNPVHVAYLHVVEGADWGCAVSMVRGSPDDWVEPLPMSDEEHNARRLLGQPGRGRG